MRKRRRLLLTALFFLTLCILFLTIFRAPFFSKVSGLFELLLLPVQREVYSAFGGVGKIGESKQITRLQEENNVLREKITKQKSRDDEIHALKDQFEASTPAPQSLLPAKVVAAKGFLPGISLPTEIIIDKGKSDQVKEGYVVVYKNNLVGIITEASPHLSRITAIANKNISFTGRTANTSALGIVSGQGNGAILLKNVVLSDKLSLGDIVLTKGDMDISGKGYPPGLVVGKIISVDKKPSALFQSAEIQSFVDLAKLTTVFIVTKK